MLHPQSEDDGLIIVNMHVTEWKLNAQSETDGSLRHLEQQVLQWCHHIQTNKEYQLHIQPYTILN